MKIACIQQEHNPGKAGENLWKALAAAKKALVRGADIILFHEELLIGYDKNMKEIAEPVDGPATATFKELLRSSDSGSAIVYGLTERKGDKFYISAPVITENGLVANYHKTHLWWNADGVRDETAVFTPGDSLTVFEHMGQKIGVLICYDGDFPQMFRSYAKLGCSMVLWLNNRESRGPEDCCIDAARRNSIVIATTCPCGRDETGHLCRGLSNIVDCDGKVLGEIDGSEGMVLAEVDLSRAMELRKKNPLFEGAREDIYI